MELDSCKATHKKINVYFQSKSISFLDTMQNRSVVIMCTIELYTKGMVNYFIIFFVKGVARNVTR